MPQQPAPNGAVDATILPPGAEHFLDLKARIRDACFENRIDILDAVQEADCSGKHLINWDHFTDILGELLQIEVTQEELKFISKRFINHRNEFSYLPFHKLLDIQPPEGHTDPELLFDSLPQPYRMIAKVMEEDIIERAWNLIVKKEEEGAVNIGPSSGWNYGVPKAAHAGRGHFSYPSFQSIAKYDVGFITAISANSDGDRLFIGTAQGRLCLVDPKRDRPLAMELAFEGAVGGVHAISNAAGRAHSTSATGGDTPMTVALAAHMADTSGGRIHVYECWNEEPHLTLRFKLNTDECISRLIISPDAKYLTVITRSNTVVTYALPGVTVKPDPRVEEEKRKEKEKVAQKSLVEDGEDGDAQQTEPEELVFPPEPIELTEEPFLKVECPAALAAKAAAAAGAAAKAAEAEETGEEIEEGKEDADPAFVPLPVPVVQFVVMSVLVAPHQEEPVTSGMMIARSGTNIFQRYNLGPTALAKDEERDQEVEENTVEDPKAKKDNKKGKGQADPEPEEEVKEPEPQWDKEWTLPAAINCCAMDSSTSLLAFGLEDGSVLVWNVHSGVVQEILGKHETRVTTVDIHRQQYVVSGSEDQLVHIYDLGSSGDSDNNGGISRRSKSRPHLVGLKNDSRLPITVVKCLSDVPMAACFDSDMCCRMYDLKSGQLVGELGTSSDGSWASILGAGNSNALTIDAHGDQLCVLVLPKSDWPTFTESSCRCDAVIDAATGPPKQPAEDEDGSTPEAPDPPPVLPSTSLNMYFTVDMICDLCPGIEKACYGAGSKHQAKNLFVTTDPEKRVDVDADIGGLGGMGGGFSVAASEGFDPVKMAFSQNGAGRAPSTVGGSRSGRKKSGSKGHARMSSRGKGTQQASLGGLAGGGLSSAMLAEPAQIKLLRAPAYLDPKRRAKADARRSLEKRPDRDHSLQSRRADLLRALVPQLN